MFILQWLLNNVWSWLCGNCHLQTFYKLQLIRALSHTWDLWEASGKVLCNFYNQHFLLERKQNFKMGLLKNYSCSHCWRSSFWHKLFWETTKRSEGLAQLLSACVSRCIKHQRVPQLIIRPYRRWCEVLIFLFYLHFHLRSLSSLGMFSHVNCIILATISVLILRLAALHTLTWHFLCLGGEGEMQQEERDRKTALIMNQSGTVTSQLVREYLISL